MTRKNPWNTLDNMLNQLGGNDAGTIPKICHHYPDRYRLLPAKGSEGDMEAFHARSYDDRILTGIYIVGDLSREQVLGDHPEIRFLAYINMELDDEVRSAIRSIRADNTLMSRGFFIRDWDRRAPNQSPRGPGLPSVENILPLVDYLREWKEAGAPSLMTCCSAGIYRSGVTALTAHSMLTRDPMVSAIRLVLAGKDALDSNWEIARIADPMLGFDGQLHAAAVNVTRARREMRKMVMKGTTPGELLDQLLNIFRYPLDEDQALEDIKSKGY
ncbi:MAG: hypothetical protein F4073_04445 [Rhodobacteraceae bacterium]|nr:hypothetical protein [Paracoccaceae bacterium]MYF44960.1 hypothetical protein [Paracoccaceae bacterium]MYG10713.1 hypothetical protein [Paracoccaceae bacterium]MYI91187.1 hypothetical protein [Paracoccaceae bacterium]MYJ86300.1 hypothetical protein [Paracoccaceae bacterium]